MSLKEKEVQFQTGSLFIKHTFTQKGRKLTNALSTPQQSTYLIPLVAISSNKLEDFKADQQRGLQLISDCFVSNEGKLRKLSSAGVELNINEKNLNILLHSHLEPQLPGLKSKFVLTTCFLGGVIDHNLYGKNRVYLRKYRR